MRKPKSYSLKKSDVSEICSQNDNIKELNFIGVSQSLSSFYIQGDDKEDITLGEVFLILNEIKHGFTVTFMKNDKEIKKCYKVSFMCKYHLEQSLKYDGFSYHKALLSLIAGEEFEEILYINSK